MLLTGESEVLTEKPDPVDAFSTTYLNVTYPGIFSGGWGLRQDFFSGVSTNSVKDRGQRERRSGGGSPSQGFHSICN
jgi:hypothetical protein